MLGNRSRRLPTRTYLELDQDFVVATTAALPSRAAVPGWWARISSPSVPLARLRAIAAERRALDHAEAAAVDVARAGGVSWAEIGQALGVTGERVRQRHAA
jgi:hypothetical protein